MHTMASCDGNGFELWRVLFRDYEGGSAIAKSNELTHLINFPSCSNKSQLQTSLNTWIDLVRRAGSGIDDASLKVMLMNILPQDFKNDIVRTPSLDTVDKILEWVFFCNLLFCGQNSWPQHLSNHNPTTLPTTTLLAR